MREREEKETDRHANWEEEEEKKKGLQKNGDERKKKREKKKGRKGEGIRGRAKHHNKKSKNKKRGRILPSRAANWVVSGWANKQTNNLESNHHHPIDPSPSGVNYPTYSAYEQPLSGQRGAHRTAPHPSIILFYSCLALSRPFFFFLVTHVALFPS